MGLVDPSLSKARIGIQIGGEGVAIIEVHHDPLNQKIIIADRRGNAEIGIIVSLHPGVEVSVESGSEKPSPTEKLIDQQPGRKGRLNSIKGRTHKRSRVAGMCRAEERPFLGRNKTIDRQLMAPGRKGTFKHPDLKVVPQGQSALISPLFPENTDLHIQKRNLIAVERVKIGIDAKAAAPSLSEIEEPLILGEKLRLEVAASIFA